MVVAPTAPRVKSPRVTPPAARPASPGDGDAEATTGAAPRSPRVRKRTRVQRPAGATSADAGPEVTAPVEERAVATPSDASSDVAAAASASSERDDAVAELRGLLDAAEQDHAARAARDDARADPLTEPDDAHAGEDLDDASAPAEGNQAGAPVDDAAHSDGALADDDDAVTAASAADSDAAAVTGLPEDGSSALGETQDADPAEAAASTDVPASPDAQPAGEALPDEPAADVDADLPGTVEETPTSADADAIGEAPVIDEAAMPDSAPSIHATEGTTDPEAGAPAESVDDTDDADDADDDDDADADADADADDADADAAAVPVPDRTPEPTRSVTVRTDSLTAPRSTRAGLAGVDETALTPSVRGDRAAAPELGDEVLVIEGLTKRFDEKVAVDDVALTVRAGSFYGIVGPNGAGKTTTMSMVTGLLRPDAGTVTVNGVDVWRDPLTAKRSIGVLPDRLRLFDRLTGAQLLHYSGALRGLDAAEIRDRSADLVAAFGLEDAVGRLVTDYSAGMTKKVALACAMIHSPRVLVLDEPFESVDPVSAANVVEILQDYVAHGGTVVLSSHGMDFIQRICDHVAIIVNGRVLAAGTMDEVRAGRTLEERFVALAGGRRTAEGFSWLHSFSD
ncbi:Daunorubicin/doxorubicin resistance ATP-binding protein DrrA [Clavibacter michiganensis]|uniref:Daunorubicin/doxorubicin resistance ATP-binding protein DrrA n=1 Tax=Clavibacter michiganensis TaxID=28447 RepID=A0A251YWX6_9MICO|nr:Daunorubicin/doxorubicin resistance ATP-binding protein DrrA [Clavibacter michiganensis]